MSNTEALPELPEPDVQWEDGCDQYGYATYSHAYSAALVREFGNQQFNAGREFERERRAAMDQPAASGEPPRTLLEQYDREQLPGYCAGYEDGRQRGYIVGHRHGLEQSAAYATAQPAPARVPLTEAQISNMWSHECVRERLTRDLVQAFARAIEAAHDITAPGAPDAGPVQ